MPARRAAPFTTCHIALGVMCSPQTTPSLVTARKMKPVVIPDACVRSSTIRFTQPGIGTVRICLPFPIRSATTQCSSRICRSSHFSPTSSARLRPHPISTARIARSRFPLRVSAQGAQRSARYWSKASQFPTRVPRRFAPFTRRIPVAQTVRTLLGEAVFTYRLGRGGVVFCR